MITPWKVVRLSSSSMSSSVLKSSRSRGFMLRPLENSRGIPCDRAVGIGLTRQDRDAHGPHPLRVASSPETGSGRESLILIDHPRERKWGSKLHLLERTE